MTLPTVRINKSQFAKLAKPTVQPVPTISKPSPGKIAIIPEASKISTIQNVASALIQDEFVFTSQPTISKPAPGKIAIVPNALNIAQTANIAQATQSQSTDQAKTDSKTPSKQQQQQQSALQSEAKYPPPKDAFKDPKIEEAIAIAIDPTKDPQSPEYKSSITFYRPEIISLTKFNPLYDEQKNQTENGVLFEALIESLRKIDVDARNFLNSSQESKNAVFKSNEELKIQLESLNSSFKQLASFIKFFTSLQNRIDVNNAFFKLKPQEFLSANFLDSNLTTYSSLSRYVSQIDKSLTLNEVLNRCLYYDGKDLDKKDNYFDHTATKCWVVSLAEMKTMINSHSRRNMKDKLSNPGAAQGYGSYPFLKVGDRITSQNLLDVGSGISINAVGAATGGGQLRFETLQNYFSRFIDDASAISTILYVTLKEARQRICSTFKDEDTSLTTRNQRLNSLIIDSYKNQNVFSRLNSFTGASLYDVGVFGDINSRQTPVFVLQPSSDVQNNITGKTYFFKGFGSEDFFTQFLTAEGTSDIQKINDYLLTLNSVKSSFFDFISNSGVLPIDDSKISPAFSTDVTNFFEDICSKLLDSSGEFLVTKPYIKSPGKYVAAGNHDLDALMFFGLASGASDNLKQAMSTRDVKLKQVAMTAETYQLDNTQRTPEQNIALMKNALYSYVLQRINEAEGSDIEYTCREIYGILTNIADVRGVGLRTNDDFFGVGNFRTDLDDGVANPFGTSAALSDAQLAVILDPGKESVVIAHDPDGSFSSTDEQKSVAGPTTTGNPEPRYQAHEDEAVKFGMFSIQSVGTEDPTSSALPYAIDDIRVTLAESSLVDTIIEIMRPIVSSNEISNFSLIIFDFICRLIGRLAPFKGIEVYIDDVENRDEPADTSGGAFVPDNEIKSALVFFIRFYALGEYNTKTVPLLFKSKIQDNLTEETNNLIRLAFSSYNIVNNLSTLFNDAKSKLLSFKTDVAEFITTYLNSDPRKYALLFNDQQLSLLMSSFQDVYDSYNTFANSSVEQSQVDQIFNSYISGMCYSPKVVSILKSFFKGQEYSSIKGYNKQIMTVGIPQGLLRELNNKFKTKAESLGKLSQQKSNDIFKILIYKIDLLNDEIVYSPKEFLFEVSRFPVKTYSKISDVSNMEISSDFETSLYKLFSTRDYSIYSVKDGAELFIESKPILNIAEAFKSADYSQFLSDVEKFSILKNHIVSFVLENYLQIISGMQFNESPFILAGNYEINALYSNLYEQSQIPQENIAKNLAVPNPNPFLRSLIHPKKFDRVFNIIFDPEFIVDESKSYKPKIEKMVNTQKLRKVEPYVGKPYYIDTDKSFIDPAFNSYFVNIETLSLD